MEFNHQVPELAALRPNTVKMLLTHVFAGTGLKDPTGNALLRNFVRLVDLAVKEYELGRESILLYGKDVELAYYVRAAGYFEEYIGTTQRASLHLKAILEYGNTPQALIDLCPPEPLVLHDPGKKDLSGIRGAITHLDERLLGATKKWPKIEAGEPVMLSPEEIQLELGSYKVTYSDLAAWLTELHGIATSFAQYTAELAQRKQRLDQERQTLTERIEQMQRQQAQQAAKTQIMDQFAAFCAHAQTA